MSAEEASFSGRRGQHRSKSYQFKLVQVGLVSRRESGISHHKGWDAALGVSNCTLGFPVLFLICPRNHLYCNVISYPATPRRTSEITLSREGDAAGVDTSSLEEPGCGDLLLGTHMAPSASHPQWPSKVTLWWGSQAPHCPAWCHGHHLLPLVPSVHLSGTRRIPTNWQRQMYEPLMAAVTE